MNEEMPTGRMAGLGASGGMPDGDMGGGMDGGMPQAPMSADPAAGDMPGGAMAAPSGEASAGPGQAERVLVEIRVPLGDGKAASVRAAQTLSVPSFSLDADYEPVPMGQSTGDASGGSRLAPGEATTVVRATIDPVRIPDLEADPNVVRVWKDGRIAPFDTATEQVQQFRADAYGKEAGPPIALLEDMGTCPIGTCDCASGTPKGNIADVAAYLGANQIWAAGLRGEGIVVGVVDGGIRATGRPIKAGEQGKPTIGNVIGGWPVASWGTTAAAWGDHGNMCSTDVLGMAPNARVYDLRISDGDALSDALAAFQWAIDRHKADGTPHVLS